MITTRDDISTLKKYVNDDSETIIGKSSDTATWCDLVFDIKPDYASEIIGIGVIDPVRFVQYEQGIDENFYERWICSIVRILDERGYKWKLFSNGHIPDYNFACKIAENMGYDNDVVVARPETYVELVNTINSFKSVIASRLHACIIAYGLDKQVIGIDWNDKVIFFGEAIGVPEKFFKPKNKTPKEVVDIIGSETHFKYNQEFRGNYRNSVVNYINKSFDFIK